jgi:hypothetical protein
MKKKKRREKGRRDTREEGPVACDTCRPERRVASRAGTRRSK